MDIWEYKDLYETFFADLFNTAHCRLPLWLCGMLCCTDRCHVVCRYQRHYLRICRRPCRNGSHKLGYRRPRDQPLDNCCYLGDDGGTRREWRQCWSKLSTKAKYSLQYRQKWWRSWPNVWYKKFNTLKITINRGGNNGRSHRLSGSCGCARKI